MDEEERYRRHRAAVERAREVIERADEMLDQAAIDDAVRQPAPPPVDWRGKSVATMSAAEYSAWCDAGKPAIQEQRSVSAAEIKIMALRAELDQHKREVKQYRDAFEKALGEVIGRERRPVRGIEHGLAQLREQVDALRSEIGELRTELDELRPPPQLKLIGGNRA